MAGRPHSGDILRKSTIKMYRKLITAKKDQEGDHRTGSGSVLIS